MEFSFDYRPSESPLVETIWTTRSMGIGSFISTAESNWEMVITRQKDRTTFSLRGPETQASLAPVPDDAEFMGIVFKHGAFMPHLPVKTLVNGGRHLPEAVRNAFWLHGTTWQFPTFENADTFIKRLMRDDLLVYDPVIAAVLRDEPQILTSRSIQRRFLQATGITQGTIRQIQRAHHAVGLLQQGISILDVIDLAGYADQPHLTRALKHYIGRTPAQILYPPG